MREHLEYADVWDQLSELSDQEIERDGVNPIVHITAHQTVENQLAQNDPKEVRRTIKKLMRQGYSRHEAIHAVGSVVMDEIWYILKEKRPFDQARFLRGLRALTEK
jgi:DNA polymerase III gamma/tau subunit